MGILLRRFAFVLAALWAALTAGAVWAQQGALVFNTIERPPFAYLENGQPTGFSIDLMRTVAEELGREIQFRWSDSFPQMLGAVEAGTVDGAVANISITSAREKVMDFSQPIFESGLQIMVMGGSGGASIWAAVFSYDLLLAVPAAFAALFVLGMLMWFFERRGEPYFDRSGREAMFPAFWWALNLVVNGGFEERLPRSIMGRLLGVIMVISSLVRGVDLRGQHYRFADRRGNLRPDRVTGGSGWPQGGHHHRVYLQRLSGGPQRSASDPRQPCRTDQCLRDRHAGRGGVRRADSGALRDHPGVGRGCWIGSIGQRITASRCPRAVPCASRSTARFWG